MDRWWICTGFSFIVSPTGAHLPEKILAAFIDVAAITTSDISCDSRHELSMSMLKVNGSGTIFKEVM
jgi:hypothetical protein